MSLLAALAAAGWVSIAVRLTFAVLADEDTGWRWFYVGAVWWACLTVAARGLELLT